MNKIVRNIFILIVILVLLLAFVPSYTSLNIDNLAYVIAIGIDVGKNEKFEICFQFTQNGSSGSESGQDQKSASIINTVEAPSLDAAINLMNSYLAKKINLSHCRLIVFSEEIAYRGIKDEIYTLTNNSETRPSTSIIISKCNAKSYLDNSSPILENLITKYYEIFPNSSKYTGYVYNATLGDFFNQLVCNNCEPFAILGGIHDNSFNENSKFEDCSDIKSSDNTFLGLRDSQNIGVAVFKGDKLVGELSASETLCLSIIKGDVESFYIRIPNPNDNNKKIDLLMYPDNSRKIDVDIINGSPYITYETKFSGKIYSIDEDSKFLDSDTLDNISQTANIYINDLLTNYLYKTSLVFESDINGFGNYCLSNFLTTSEFKKYNWLDSYSDSTFKVSIKTEIESSFLVTET